MEHGGMGRDQGGLWTEITSKAGENAHGAQYFPAGLLLRYNGGMFLNATRRRHVLIEYLSF